MAGAYHHGDLSAQLMALAIEHIERTGTEKLSLRALAREAGVSPAAPFRHFPTKQCLLAALATRGFRQLRSCLLAAQTPGAEVRQRFFEIGRAYLDFAGQNRVAYQLMFGAVVSDFSAYDDLYVAAQEAYGVLHGVLEALIEAHDLDVDVETLGGVAWAGVHGFASLAMTRDAVPHDSAAESGPVLALRAVGRDVDRALHVLFDGLIDANR